MKRSLILMLAVIFAAFGAQSCLKGDNDYEKQKKYDDNLLAEFIAFHNLSATRHSTGFYYMDITSESLSSVATTKSNVEAELKKGDVVTFYYKMSLLSGPLVETNLLGGKPAKFKLMSYTVIPEALDEGVSLMRVGSKYRFFIPSYLAYGSYSTSDFGLHSNFIVEIEVTGKETESDLEDFQRDSISRYVNANYQEFKEYASGLFFIDSIPGSGNRPFAHSAVIFDFARKNLDNSLILQANGAQAYLGRDMAVQGLEEGLKLMRENGTAIMIMPASIGFRQSVCVIPRSARAKLYNDRIINNNVEPYTMLKYVVNLKVANF